MPGIDHIGFTLGSEVVACADIVASHPTRKPPHLETRPWAEEYCQTRNLRNTTVERPSEVTQLFRALLKDFFEAGKISGKDVDLLVYGGEVEHNAGGERPYLLAHEFGLPPNAQIMWHFTGCATGLSAVNLALERLASTGGTDALILLNCVIRDELAHPRFMADMVCGDAVMLLHVTTRTAHWEVISSHVTCATEFHDYGFNPRVNLDPFTIVRHGANHLREHLGDHLAEVKAILPVYNGFAQWPWLARALEYPVDRIRLDTLPHGAHIDSIDPLRSLSELDGEFQPGDQLLLYAQTLGVTFNSLLLRRCDT